MRATPHAQSTSAAAGSAREGSIAVHTSYSRCESFPALNTADEKGAAGFANGAAAELGNWAMVEAARTAC